VNVTPFGGTSPYIYSWLTTPAQTTATATGLVAGTYTVTVTDAHNCVTAAVATVTQPTLLTAAANTISNALCNGINTGSVNVNPSGGTTPYTYSWTTSPVQTTATASGLPAGIYTVTVTDAHNCSATATTTVTQPSTLAITTSTLTNVSCKGGNNGSVNVTPTGGTTPYTYSWHTAPAQTTATATGLPAGTYTVTVTDDHNCSVTASATVAEPTALAATASTPANVSCNGGNNGSVTVVPDGGTAPYSYSWNTAPIQTDATATGLTVGTYTATVTDAHGCIANATATITQPTTLTATASTVSNVACNGGNNGSATVVPGGGTIPYSYSWSTAPVQTDATATGLTAGTYTVTVTDEHGCSVNVDATITEPNPLSASAAGDNILCNGGTTIINVAAAGGTTPYDGIGMYTVGAGIYSYMITDSNGCSTSTSSTITEPDALSLTGSSTDVSCDDISSGSAMIIASGGTAPYTYEWDANTKNQLTPTATSLAKGAYNVTVTDQHGCAKTAIVIVDGQLSPLELTASATPAACYDGNSGSISVSTTGGTPPYTYIWSNGYVGMNLSGAAAGQYSISVTDGAGCTTNATYTVTQPSPVQVSLTAMVYPTGFNVSTFSGSDGAVKTDATGGTAPYTYLWSNGNSGPELQNAPAGQYTVTVTDNNGCIDTASVVLAEPNVLELPTGYSPNNDGKNDFFVIHGINAYPNNNFVVFNRWGNEVYSADGYHNTWNGKNKDGKDLPDGTYFVVLTINGGAITRNGYVDLRR
jgi:gliding motility-associated-like protein